MDEFEQKLYNHLTAFAQTQISKKKEIKNNISENNLLVQYYLPEYSSFSSNFKGLKRDDLVTSEFINENKEELKQLIKEISDIKLKFYNEISNDESDNDMEDTHSPFNVSILGGSVSKELSTKKQMDVIHKVKKLLNVQLDDGFFNVGGLMELQIRFSSPFFSSTNKVEGTETEKEKDEKIQNFLVKLRELEAYLDMFNYIGSYFIAPLVLTNNGQMFNESITVKLKLPKDVEILNPEDFKIPSPLVIEEFTDGIINYILRHNKESIMKMNITCLNTIIES